MYILLSCCAQFKEIIKPDVQMLLKGKSELGTSAEVLSLNFVCATLKSSIMFKSKAFWK